MSDKLQFVVSAADETDGLFIRQARTPALPAICAHLRCGNDKPKYSGGSDNFVGQFVSYRVEVKASS